MKLTIVKILTDFPIKNVPFSEVVLQDHRYVVVQDGSRSFVGSMTENKYICNLTEQEAISLILQKKLVIEKVIEPEYYEATKDIAFAYQVGFGFQFDSRQGSFKKGLLYGLLKRENYFPMYLSNDLERCSFELSYIDGLIKEGLLKKVTTPELCFIDQRPHVFKLESYTGGWGHPKMVLMCAKCGKHSS